jgi:hypothetical protein
VPAEALLTKYDKFNFSTIITKPMVTEKPDIETCLTLISNIYFKKIEKKNTGDRAAFLLSSNSIYSSCFFFMT